MLEYSTFNSLFPARPMVQLHYLYGFILFMKISVDPDQLASDEAS